MSSYIFRLCIDDKYAYVHFKNINRVDKKGYGHNLS